MSIEKIWFYANKIALLYFGFIFWFMAIVFSLGQMAGNFEMSQTYLNRMYFHGILYVLLRTDDACDYVKEKQKEENET